MRRSPLYPGQMDLHVLLAVLSSYYFWLGPRGVQGQGIFGILRAVHPVHPVQSVQSRLDIVFRRNQESQNEYVLMSHTLEHAVLQTGGNFGKGYQAFKGA